MTTPEYYRTWFSDNARRRVTAQQIADALNISRNAANTRMNKGLSADDIITVSRSLKVNPVIALTELGHLTIDEVLCFLDSDGTLLASASPEQLVLQLADDMLTADVKIELGKKAMRLPTKDELEQARSKKRDPALHEDGIVEDWDDSVPYAADSSPDEAEERWKRGEDPVD